MIIKLISIAIFLLFAHCTQPRDKALHSGLEWPVIDTSAVNRADVVTFAKKYLGIAYHYAGTEPAEGFDCSGFVYFVFKNFDIDMPRGSGEYMQLGTALKPEEFKEGDVLVFYGHHDDTQIGHVGIICEANGMNSRFIHSSSGKAYGVTISELGSPMYTRRFYKCIDVIH